LFTLLIATAVGARFSSVIKRWPTAGLPGVAAALIVLSLLYIAAAESITDSALAWAQWARIAVVIALLFPIGLLLGVFLPTGIDAAVAAAGPGLSDILWRVICLGEGLETAERAMKWPNRAGKLVLLLALDRLVTHYRLD